MGGKNSKSATHHRRGTVEDNTVPGVGGRHLEERGSELEVSNAHIDIPLNEQAIPPVPISARRCTDCFFCLVFLAYMIGILVIGVVSFQTGDPERLVYGADYKGRTCGAGNKTGEKYLVYPRTQQDILLAGNVLASSEPWRIQFYTVCAEECPLEGQIVCNDEGHALLDAALQARPGSTYETEASYCTANAGLFPLPQCHNADIRKHCWKTLFDTVPLLFRCMPTYVYDVRITESGCVEQLETVDPISGANVTRCVKYKEVTELTTIEPTDSDILFDSFNTYSRLFQEYVADVVKSWPVILTSGLVVSVVVGFVYVVSLWLFVRLVVWGSVFGVWLMTLAFTIYLYIKAGLLTTALVQTVFYQQATDLSTNVNRATGTSLLNATMLSGQLDSVLVSNGTALLSSVAASENYQAEFANAAYFMTAVSLMLTLIILMLTKRIQRAIEIFQEASHAIMANPCLVALPCISVPILVGLVAYWVASTAYIASSGSYQVTQLNYTMALAANQEAIEVAAFGTFSYVEVFVAFNFIGFLWASHFISAIMVFIIAGTVGHWYWKGNEAESSGTAARWSMSPLLRATYVVLRFHLGSAAFGALLVALVQFVRYFAAYVENRTKSVSKRNRLLKAVVCCLHCLLKCLEYCVKFISRNAFIIGALYGDSFCSSTKQAFVTITSNLAQVALVTFLGDIILRFGQLLVAMISAFACWLYLDTHPEYDYGGELQLKTFWFPTLLSFMLGWFVANECLAVYDLTVDTLLISFCQDQKLKKHAEHHNQDIKHTLKSTKSMAHFIDTQKKKELASLDQEHRERIENLG